MKCSMLRSALRQHSLQSPCAQYMEHQAVLPIAAIQSVLHVVQALQQVWVSDFPVLSRQ